MSSPRGPGNLVVKGTLLQGVGKATGSSRVVGVSLVLRLSSLTLTQGSPFYDMLATFVAATAGLTPVFDQTNYPAFLAGVGGHYKGSTWPSMTTDLGACVDDFRRGLLDPVTAENSLCCMLANSAWESTPFKRSHRHWRHAEVQFLRHVRNAASHGNRWNFENPDKKGHRKGTPNLPAGWRGFAIDHTKKGAANPLHGTQCFGQSLGSADLLRLLLDGEPLLT